VKRRWLLLLVASACSIDESGLERVDGGVDAVACVTLDAACLGPLASSWHPVAVTDASCNAGFTRQDLVTNPHVETGGCACGGCQVVGAYTCDAAVPISGGNNCGDNPIANAPPGACTQAQAQHLEAHAVQATGSVGCFAPNDAGIGAAADPLAVCVPGCTADFCASASRCIISEGDVACPAGFTLYAHAGTGADPGCAVCACDAGPPTACGGSVTGFQTTNCTDAGLVHTYAVGSCNVFDSNIDYQSVLVTLTPPAVSCSVTVGPPDMGDASLREPKTICCQ
jgi:hypothetical protein